MSVDRRIDISPQSWQGVLGGAIGLLIGLSGPIIYTPSENLQNPEFGIGLFHALHTFASALLDGIGGIKIGDEIARIYEASKKK